MTYEELKSEAKKDWKKEFDVDLTDDDFEESKSGCYVSYIDYDISRISVYRHCALIDDVQIRNDGRSEFLNVLSEYKYSDY